MCFVIRESHKYGGKRIGAVLVIFSQNPVLPLAICAPFLYNLVEQNFL
jgi:hypothetical protein